MTNRRKSTVLHVQGTAIAVVPKAGTEYICLTDIARFKNSDHPDDVIRNWLRNRNTIEFLGVWERLNNPAFNPVEFDGIRLQIRDHATLEQLVVLTNLESLNAVLIRQGLAAPDRLHRLNEVAITQMRSLITAPELRRLKDNS